MLSCILCRSCWVIKSDILVGSWVVDDLPASSRLVGSSGVDVDQHEVLEVIIRLELHAITELKLHAMLVTVSCDILQRFKGVGSLASWRRCDPDVTGIEHHSSITDE